MIGLESRWHLWGGKLTLKQQLHFPKRVLCTFHKAHLHNCINADLFVFKCEVMKRINHTSCFRVWEDLQMVLQSASSFSTL